MPARFRPTHSPIIASAMPNAGFKAAVIRSLPKGWIDTAVNHMILGLVMFVYMIALFVFYVLPGTKGANKYGADPYGQDVEQVFA